MRKSEEEINQEEINEIAYELADLFREGACFYKDRTPKHHTMALTKILAAYNNFRDEFMETLMESLMSMYELGLSSKKSMMIYLRNEWPNATDELEIYDTFLSGENTDDMLRDLYITCRIPHSLMIDIILESY